MYDYYFILLSTVLNTCALTLVLILCSGTKNRNNEKGLTDSKIHKKKTLEQSSKITSDYYDDTYNGPIDVGDQYENLTEMKSIHSKSNTTSEARVTFEDITSDTKLSIQDLPEGSSTTASTNGGTDTAASNTGNKTPKKQSLLGKDPSQEFDPTMRSEVTRKTVKDFDPTMRSEVTKLTVRGVDPTMRSEISKNQTTRGLDPTMRSEITKNHTIMAVDPTPKSEFSLPKNAKPDPEIKIEPGELKFSLAGGSNNVQLANQTAKRLALKIKTTNNAKYRIYPIYGYVEPHESKKFEVMRFEGGEHTTDNLIFVYSEADVAENDAESHFKQEGVAMSRQVISLIA